ncbi:MAG: hypothetical protein MPJ50_06020 [Pirellulales bacterium]|nr:hypothetical protein [Pirellulales bacterium]
MCSISLLMAVYAAWLAWQLRSPRVAFCEGELRLYLTASKAIPVPLQHVECFLLGEAPALLGKSTAKTNTLRIRLAERAADFQQRNVLRLLGNWNSGYVTLHGTWTEPLTVDLVRKLNSLLSQAKRECPLSDEAAPSET